MISIVVITLLCIAFGAALGFAAIKFRVDGDPLTDKIDAILPQTQCGQCGYPGCRPYAEAIAGDEAAINQCPPGGMDGVKALAELLDRDIIELNPDNGTESAKTVAVIDEQTCIGCTLCIQACPVDAILGSAKHMHTVITDECTGCDLCLPPCPVDCILMVPVEENIIEWRWPSPNDTGRFVSEQNKGNVA